MDKKNNIINNVISGMDLEENMPKLFNQLADQYQGYSLIRLAMNYYGFYETYSEGVDGYNEEAIGILKQINGLVKEHVLESSSGSKREEAIKLADGLRNEIMKKMQTLSVFGDKFKIYEFVLNRIEYKFKPDTDLIDVDNDEFSREILRYIFETENHFVINENIKEIIGQLPIRITKQKYYDIITESTMAYTGSSMEAFETYLYLVRSATTIGDDNEIKDDYPELLEHEAYLKKLNYKDISHSEFEKAVEVLNKAIKLMESEAMIYYGAQIVINELYAYILCMPYGIDSGYTADEKEAAIHIIKKAHHHFFLDKEDESPLQLNEQFALIEGVQEAISENLDRLEAALYEVGESHSKKAEELMLAHVLNVLLKVQGLLSSSLFIEFDKEKSDKAVTKEMAKKESENLIDDLEKLFKEYDRIVVRAFMANSLSKIPVFLKNHGEVMDYIRYSLEKCTDNNEKAACFDIINDFIINL